jgi:hypothetical protein
MRAPSVRSTQSRKEQVQWQLTRQIRSPTRPSTLRPTRAGTSRSGRGCRRLRVDRRRRPRGDREVEGAHRAGGPQVFCWHGRFQGLRETATRRRRRRRTQRHPLQAARQQARRDCRRRACRVHVYERHRHQCLHRGHHAAQRQARGLGPHPRELGEAIHPAGPRRRPSVRQRKRTDPGHTGQQPQRSHPHDPPAQLAPEQKAASVQRYPLLQLHLDHKEQTW